MSNSRRRASFPLVLALVFCGRLASATDVSLQAPGASGSLTEALRNASLTLETAGNEAATAQDILAAARADYARLINALYDAGFYSGVITIRVDGKEAANIPLISGPTRINRVDLTVAPGPAFTFSTARVAPLPPGTELPDDFSTGERARAGVIGNAAKAGVDGWRETGHAKAAVTDQSITADHRTATLATDITITPGPRLTFGDLAIARPGNVRPDRVRQIAGLETGKVFSPTDLAKASQRLRRTGAFRSVVLREADTAGADGSLDIEADLVDAKPRRFGFGAELASLEGLTLSGFWLHRNLLGGAERLRLEGEVSGIGGDSGGIDYRFSARFERPATFTPDTTLFLGARVEELDDPDYRERTVRLGGGFTHIFSDELSGEIGLAYQYSEIDDDLGSRSNELLLLPAGLTFDNRDNPLNATEGFYVDLEAMPFFALDAENAAMRLYADARAYVGLGKDDRVVLAARTQIGSVSGAQLTDVPPNMLFFSGGADTVRGQPYQSLAVDLGGGNRLGGRSFFALSGEVRARVADQWSVVAFADTGFVGQDSWGTRNGDWHSGAGFGVRYDTGIGPIRLDVGTPLDGDAGQDFELYIGIGQAF